MARGWDPKGTATYARAQSELEQWARRQAEKQACAWCWGQGYLVERSTLGWLPIACPMCVNHADDDS